MRWFGRFRIPVLLIILCLPPESHARPTRHPIVMAHGLLAGSVFFSLRDAARRLRRNGHRVFVTEVSAANSISYRAAQLGRQVNRIRWWTGAEKVNVIAHSMGGLDTRYLISSLGFEGKIASLTTVATPHRGSSAAAAVYEDLVGGKGIPVFLVDLLVGLTNWATPLFASDIKTAVYQLTPDFLAGFNERNPDSDRVLYQSWEGVSSPDDDMHRLLRESHGIILEAEGPNDGLVSSFSARWGDFRGTVPADHLAQIGIGRRKSASNDWDHTELYLSIAEDLAARGY